MDTFLVPISALQHYAYCPRQYALIHIERVWAENAFTAQGRELHERVDSGVVENRKGVRYERSVQVASHTYGLIGKLDLVEIDVVTGRVTPVEYKRGRTKQENWDRIQLCAQALCLEDCRGIEVISGAIWYGASRRREVVVIDKDLRAETLAVISGARALYLEGHTPRAVYEKKCDRCSLVDNCNPKHVGADRSAAYIQNLYQSIHRDEEAP